MSPRESRRRVSRADSTRLQNIRAGIQQLFTGESIVGRSDREDEVPDTPKTPRLPLGFQISRTRLDLPHLNRSTTSSTTRSTHVLSQATDSPPSPDTPISARPITPNSFSQLHRAMSRPPPSLQSSNRPFIGVDPEEQHLAELAATGRRRQRCSRHKATRKCFPRVKNKKLRAKAINCLVSGLFLIVVLSAYLALALSTRQLSQEFHVLLIMIILVTTIYFCHSLLSLCILAARPPSSANNRPRMSAIVGPGGFANPPRPIRVALARDEEAIGVESEATKFPPPAYGLWRESVRMDPNGIYWQRNEAVDLTRQNSTGSTGNRVATAPRPPSYISEDGVGYIMEATPRSIAPPAEAALPQHPSERGRLPPMITTDPFNR